VQFFDYKISLETDSIPKTHFHTIPIGICGFGGFLWLGSEVTQRISRGDNCERFVHFFVFFFFETKAGMIKKENNAL